MKNLERDGPGPGPENLDARDRRYYWEWAQLPAGRQHGPRAFGAREQYCTGQWNLGHPSKRYYAGAPELPQERGMAGAPSAPHARGSCFTVLHCPAYCLEREMRTNHQWALRRQGN